MDDTIAAISTALGVGAISIIRVSGKDAIKNVNKIFSRDLTKKESHTITYGNIIDKKEIIDEVLVTVMKAPKTFTKEDVVEINCHGGIATTQKTLKLLLENGCRMAEPGEFTKRAFLNGRIDLTESEAIMDIINVKTEKARKIAINNLKGKTTNKIKELRKKLIDILTNIEVNIDYPEYLDIEVITTKKIKDSLKDITEELDQIIKNSKNSKIIKEGINVAIIGRPNVGKSSILNTLIGENKAIVTNIPGTTRDIVEGQVNLDGILLNLIDTAGIRETKNIVEQIGVEKSLNIKEEADLVILVLNNNDTLTEEDKKLIKDIENKKHIIVINKNDLDKKINIKNIKDKNIIYTNTLDDNGLKPLKDKIRELFSLGEIETDDFTYVSNVEQLNRLEESRKRVDDIKKALDEKLPIDMIEIDIKNIWNTLGEIIGETYTEELLDQLFKDFCVGK